MITIQISGLTIEQAKKDVKPRIQELFKNEPDATDINIEIIPSEIKNYLDIRCWTIRIFCPRSYVEGIKNKFKKLTLHLCRIEFVVIEEFEEESNL